MIVSLCMMVGRVGSLMGNIFFPALMGLGCLPPFLMVSLFMYCKPSTNLLFHFTFCNSLVS